jgi:hypothetical protein
MRPELDQCCTALADGARQPMRASHARQDHIFGNQIGGRRDRAHRGDKRHLQRATLEDEHIAIILLAAADGSPFSASHGRAPQSNRSALNVSAIVSE